MILQNFKIQPGEALPIAIKDQLKQINDQFTRTKNRDQYLKSLKDVFNLSGDVQVTKESKIFLGGFIEGEASLNVSVKKHSQSKFGVLVDPEFSITQHVNGFSMLYFALVVLNAGRISYKSGSNATLVFRIDSRQTLKEKVLPFLSIYVTPYGSTIKANRLVTFKQIMDLFDQDAHQNVKDLLYKILPLWDVMRMQVGQSNQAFANLQEAQQYVISFVKNKNN